MIRLIILGVIGLLVGLGGGTGVAMMGAKRTHAADSVANALVLKAHTDSVEADSVAKQEAADSTAAADSMAAHATASSTAAPVVTTPAHGGAAPAKGATTVVPTPVPALPHAPKPPAPSIRQLTEATVSVGGTGGVVAPAGVTVSPKRIAKIFAAMPAKDAAKVMQEMSDDDVHVILGAMSDRQAAAILAGFPVDRVARISRAAIHAPAPKTSP